MARKGRMTEESAAKDGGAREQAQGCAFERKVNHAGSRIAVIINNFSENVVSFLQLYLQKC